MNRKMIFAALLSLAAATVSVALAQTPDPSLHEVYEATKAGHYEDAQAMMDRVLRDHPDSAKAHYVEAELLARQHKMSAAAGELATAERLSPGLPKEDPRSVAQLRAEISGGGQAVGNTYQSYHQSSGFGGWLLPVIVIGVILLLVMLVRATRRVAPVMPVAYGPGGMPGPGMPGYGMGGMGPMGPMGGGGLGSSIVGGLATGAALGAGLVAGEELMHHFTDGNRGSGYVPPLADNSGVNDNMGGQDFGVQDSGSWDDGGSVGDGGGGGGGDWG